MSSIVSRRPSFLNQSNEDFWMSMRFGRSRTCSSRLNDLRARGETTVVVKKNSLPWDVRNSASNRRQCRRAGMRRRPKRGATNQGTGTTPPAASRSLGGSRYWMRTVAPPARTSKRRYLNCELLELDAGAGLFELRLD